MPEERTRSDADIRAEMRKLREEAAAERAKRVAYFMQQYFGDIIPDSTNTECAAFVSHLKACAERYAGESGTTLPEQLGKDPQEEAGQGDPEGGERADKLAEAIRMAFPGAPKADADEEEFYDFANGLADDLDAAREAGGQDEAGDGAPSEIEEMIRRMFPDAPYDGGIDGLEDWFQAMASMAARAKWLNGVFASVLKYLPDGATADQYGEFETVWKEYAEDKSVEDAFRRMFFGSSLGNAGGQDGQGDDFGI